MSDLSSFLSTRNKVWSAELWDGLIEAIGARLAPLEEQLNIQKEVTDAIIARGLTVIEQELAPIVAQADEVLNQATADIEAKIERFERKVTGGTVLSYSTSPATVSNGKTINIIIAQEDREFFAPTPYLSLSRASTIETWAIGKLISFNRITGALSLTLEQVTGAGGPYNDWVITSLPGATLLQKAYYEQTLALRNQVAADKIATGQDRAAAASSATTAGNAATASIQAKDASIGAFNEMRRAIAEPILPPVNPEIGQIWYDGSVVRVFDGVGFVPTVTASIGGLRFESGSFDDANDGVVVVGGGFSFAMVFLNGALLSEGTDYDATSPNIVFNNFGVGDEYFIWAYQAIDATDYDTREEVNEKLKSRGLDLPSLDGFTSESPLYIAHRNQAQLYPDQTYGSFAMSAKSPYVHGLELDCRVLKDGGVVAFHDTNIDRVTTGQGSVEALTTPQFLALVVDADRWHGSNIPDGTRLVTVAEILRDFIGQKLFFPEIKTTGKSKAIVDEFISAGISTKHAVFSSFTLSDLAYPKSRGYQVMLNVTATTPEIVTSAVNAGVEWVGIQKGATPAHVAMWTTAGIKVVAWTVNRRFDRDALAASGAVGFYSDDVEYLARKKPYSLSSPWGNGEWAPGMIAIDDAMDAVSRGRVYPGLGWGWKDTKEPSLRDYVLQGWLGKIPNGDFSIVARIRLAKAYEFESEWFGFAITQDDRPFRDDQAANIETPQDFYSNGYNCLCRLDGRVDIYEVNDGFATYKGEVVPSNIRAKLRPPAEAIFKISMVGSTLTVARLNEDGTELYSNSDSAAKYRGGYLHIGRNKASGIIESVKVSYGSVVTIEGGARGQTFYGPIKDCNDIAEPGFYIAANAALNRPTDKDFYLEHMENMLHPDYAIQIAHYMGTSRPVTYTRKKRGGNWDVWKLTSLEVVGNVYDGDNNGEGGGAIIQRGSNANGEFIKFADGTQKCWGITTVIPVANTLSSRAFTFPASFAAQPRMTSNLESEVPGTAVQAFSVGIVTPNGATAFVLRGNGTGTNITWEASGRWK